MLGAQRANFYEILRFCEDVFPIENRDFPASYVSLPEGSSCHILRVLCFFLLISVFEVLDTCGLMVSFDTFISRPR